ncbi:MAG TPA: hypothetical protein VIE69_06945 [Methylophilaceae bacterium]|jgi:hypothetical protein
MNKPTSKSQVLATAPETGSVDVTIVDETKEAKALLGDIASDPDLQPVPTQEEKAAAAIDYEGEARQVIQLALDGLSPLYPFLTDIYTPEAVNKLSQSAGVLMKKYGMTAGEFFMKWSAEITFGMVAIPLLFKTANGYRDFKAEQARVIEQSPTPTPSAAKGADLSQKV